MTEEGRSMLGRLGDAVTGRVLDTVDPDVLLEHVDVNALLDRIDVNALLDRVDVNRLLERVDVDGLLARADVEALVRRSGVPDIVAASVAASSGRAAGSALDLARRQLLVLDVVVTGLVDRILRRRRLGWADAPPQLRPDAPRVSAAGRVDLSGRYAGPVTRAVALVVDGWLLAAAGTLVLAGLDILRRTLFEGAADVDASGWAWVLAFAVGSFLYTFLCIEIAGRTPGKALVGLRVVRWTGDPVGPGNALVRTLAFPLSVAIGGLGLLLAVPQRHRRALHDLLGGTVVVHDWAPRPAELPAALSHEMLHPSIP